MKIAILQARLRSDRPADNMEFIKHACKGEALSGVELAVLPPLCLSGRLGRGAQQRPGVAFQYEKVWESFLELSAGFPKIALASTRLLFQENGPAREEAFVLRAGQLLYQQAQPKEGEEVWPRLLLNGLNMRFIPGQKSVARAESGVDVLVTFRNRQFQGRPYRPSSPGPAQAWRLNASVVGGDGPFIYDGASTVFDPTGDLKGWAYGFETATIIFDTDSRSLPSLADKLPPREPVETLYKALKTGLGDYMRSGGPGQVVIGLSGGLDSALVAALAVDTLGADKVLGVAMPSEYNAPESLALARELAKNLGIQFMTLPIDGLREAFTRSFLLAPWGEAKEGHLADENIQARIRGALLMYIANREDRFVLVNANKSEAAMGYSTIYGDTCGAIAPIGDVYKTTAYELAEYVNREKEIIPLGVITRPPSAELKPGQKDEDSLPPYEILDDILRRHLEGRQSGSRVAKEGGHSPMTVAWVLSSYKRAAYKRAQSPFALIASTHPLDGLDWL